MFSYPRKSVQRYVINSIYTTLYDIYLIYARKAAEKGLKAGVRKIFSKKIKIFSKRFGSLKIVRTFAIPKQSGGGEMVDTLL